MPSSTACRIHIDWSMLWSSVFSLFSSLSANRVLFGFVTLRSMPFHSPEKLISQHRQFIRMSYEYFGPFSILKYICNSTVIPYFTVHLRPTTQISTRRPYTPLHTAWHGMAWHENKLFVCHTLWLKVGPYTVRILMLFQHIRFIYSGLVFIYIFFLFSKKLWKIKCYKWKWPMRSGPTALPMNIRTRNNGANKRCVQ